MEKNLFIEALKVLDQEDLLGAVGRFILQNAEDYPLTIENGTDWVENIADFEKAISQMSWSELCGGQDSLAQIEWIAEEEFEKFEEEFYDF